MRRGFVVLVVVLLVLATSVAMANFDWGFGALLSWGTEKEPYTSRMVLKEEGTGRDLVPVDGIIMPALDRAILGQIIFDKDMKFGSDAFDFYWSTLAAPQGKPRADGKGDWHVAKFDQKLGWIFRVDPSEYITDGIHDTPFQMCVWMKNGTKPFGRIFLLKLTFPKSRLSRDGLWIRPTEPQQPVTATAPSTATVTDAAKVDDNFARLSAAIDKLGKNQQAIADSINANGAVTADLAARVGRLEAWADAVIAQSKQPTQPTPAVVATTPAKFSWRLVLPPGKWGINASCNGVERTFAGPFCGTVEFRDATPGEVLIRLMSGQSTTTWRSVTLTKSCTITYIQQKEVR